MLTGKDTHTYKPLEDVVVWTDNVGPYNNPQDAQGCTLHVVSGTWQQSLVLRATVHIAVVIRKYITGLQALIIWLCGH